MITDHLNVNAQCLSVWLTLRPYIHNMMLNDDDHMLFIYVFICLFVHATVALSLRLCLNVFIITFFFKYFSGRLITLHYIPIITLKCIYISPYDDNTVQCLFRLCCFLRSLCAVLFNDCPKINYNFHLKCEQLKNLRIHFNMFFKTWIYEK